MSKQSSSFFKSYKVLLTILFSLKQTSFAQLKALIMLFNRNVTDSNLDINIENSSAIKDKLAGKRTN